MIPLWSAYLFFFVAGGAAGWVCCHCIIGYLYERDIQNGKINKRSGG